MTPPVSLLLLSLSFPPLGSFARHQIYFSLNPQIPQFSCNDLFFFLFSPACVRSFLQRGANSSFSPQLEPQFYLCGARILSQSISLNSSSDHSSCRLQQLSPLQMLITSGTNLNVVKCNLFISSSAGAARTAALRAGLSKHLKLLKER